VNSRSVTSLGHQGGRRVFWRSRNVLNYVQHIFSRGGEKFVVPLGTGMVSSAVFKREYLQRTHCCVVFEHSTYFFDDCELIKTSCGPVACYGKRCDASAIVVFVSNIHMLQICRTPHFNSFFFEQFTPYMREAKPCIVFVGFRILLSAIFVDLRTENACGM